MSDRFTYARYDQTAVQNQEALKLAFEAVEALIDGLSDGGTKTSAYTYLEEAYAAVSKAIQDDQISRSNQIQN